ncbi:DUF421 domain-containing protein [Caldalkalibacillus mannanilyticus]|uniref:DUF421 domain-containing protein n=1 Tax=Caldalkalibacillus mannanilyticus TaxID=1418 RepID=UPI000468FC37|nr:DUF421 domain-containing protein [Caldalkalibacillus mannanilyticus]
MDIGILVLRTVFIYFFIMVIMRIMGKREIGKLSIFDLVVSIMIAELAVISLESTMIPMFHSLVPIIVLFIIQITMSYISLKSQKIRDIVDGKPSIIVEHGKLKESEMKKQRYNLDDLLLQLRENKIHSLSQVEFAILEPSGKLTVFPKEEELNVTKKDLNIPAKRFELPVILIKDQDVLEEGLKQLGKNRFWLKAELKKRAGTSDFKKILFCSIDSTGEWFIELKDPLK